MNSWRNIAILIRKKDSEGKDNIEYLNADYENESEDVIAAVSIIQGIDIKKPSGDDHDDILLSI